MRTYNTQKHALVVDVVRRDFVRGEFGRLYHVQRVKCWHENAGLGVSLAMGTAV